MQNQDGKPGIWLLLALAFAALGWGFYRGDVTPMEANLLLAANGAADAEPSHFGALLRLAGKPLGVIWSPFAVRLISLASIWLALAVGFRTLRSRLGERAAAAAALATACTPAVLWLPTRCTDEAIIAASFTVALCLFVEPLLRWKITLGVLLVAFAGWLASDAVSWDDSASRRFRAVGLALLLGGPWLTAALPLVIPRGLASLPRASQQRLSAAALLLLTAFALAAVLPGRWPIWSALLAASAALTCAVGWKAWCQGELAPSTERSQRIWFFAAQFGLPAAAVVGALYRIETDYHLMERVQAFFLAGLAALALAWAIPRRRPALQMWLPILLVAAAGKWLYCDAGLAERDHWNSPRPFAHAVGETIPAGGVLWTDLPVDAAYRYYLNRPIQPVAAATADPFGRLLSPAADFPRGWRLVRRIAGSPFGPLEILQADAEAFSTPIAEHR